MSKEHPPEFPTQWHYEQHLIDLERELLGYQRRLLELENSPDAAVARAEAESGVEAVRAQLAKYGKKPAAKRPARAKETR